MYYTPRHIPPGASLDELKTWLATELANLQTAGHAAVDGLQLKPLYAAPARVRDGLTVLADGTQWNPGAGPGVYTWYAGSWKKLG